MDKIFDFPKVSIITVNLNGKDYLSTLFNSIKELDYPKGRIELIVVDNGSSDGSVEFLSGKWPDIKIIRNSFNTGFAAANNQGAKAAAGDYVAFLNNDTKVDAGWLTELIKPVYGNKETVCSGSKVLSIDGKNLDFVGGMINFEGKGFQIDYGLAAEKDIHSDYRYLPFVNGGAMLVDRKVFLETGGFDEDFFAYYEDVDFGWRLWVLGYKVIFAPKSIVYHVHHGTSKIFSEDKLRFLKERNALYAVFKNYDDGNLAKVFSGTLASIYGRIFVDVKFDYRKYYDFTLKDKKSGLKAGQAEVKNTTGISGFAAGKGSQGRITENIADGITDAYKASETTEIIESAGLNTGGVSTGDKSGGNESDKKETAANDNAWVKIDAEPLSSLMAVKSFLDELPKLRQKRQFIQANRKRDDKAVFTYFKGQFLAVSPDAEYQRNQIDILKSLGIYEIFEKQIKRNLLIISSEVISAQMAGPAIRVYNFAKILSEHLNVTLAIPNEPAMEEQVFKIAQYKDEASLRPLLEQSDIVLCAGMTFSKFKSIRNSDKYLIMDIYDPYNLASLIEYKDETIEKQLDVYKSVHFITNEMLYYGDFYICASERQRDFWLGMLAALGRVNPYSYNQDPAMRKLIDVVPFGLPSEKPLHTKDVLKGVIKGIEKDDFVLIWGGGIYNWFDPLTLVKAMAKVAEKRRDIKLFFLGVKHPNPQVKELSLVNETVELAKKFGLEGKNIFFNFGWVDYDQRQNYFLESDAGVITHPEHIETRFAFRTRILDYLWTGLPIISTKGDSLSELVEKEGLGLIVDAMDVETLAEKIIYMAENRDFYNSCRQKIAKAAEVFNWENVCEPLIRFCSDPVSSAVRKNLRPDQVHSSVNVLDIAGGGFGSGSGGPATSGGSSYLDHDDYQAQRKTGAGYLIKRYFYHLFHGGPKKASQIYSNYRQGK
jgi:GT2 family glycosyltransferase/glycosyltransferase involved in cell wall biosynthesis